MRIGIMQPYFFPYLGYFSLIRATDLWVVFDEAQFIRHGWIERNRIMNTDGSWQYIKVPLVKGPRTQKIKDTHIRNDELWQDKILAQLTCYKRKAPYYESVIDLIRQVIFRDCKSISDLNVCCLQSVCEFLNMEFKFNIFSESEIHIPEGVVPPGEWALHIANHYNSSIYINPPGGKNIFDESVYHSHGIQIQFIQNNLRPYVQRTGNFEPGLSIIDVLMFNTPDETISLIDDYSIA